MTDPKPTSTVKRDWLTTTPKWVLLAGFWLAQGAGLYLLQALLYQSQSVVEAADTVTIGGTTETIAGNFWGQWPSWEDYSGLLVNSEFVVMMLVTIAVLTAGQMVFLLPVRRPGLTPGKGKGLFSSLFTAGLVIGGLCAGAFMAVGEMLRTAGGVDMGFVRQYPLGGTNGMIATVVVLGWLVATPLLFRFARPGRREAVLARLAKKLFIGTIIEVALLIPLDVMVRRKTDCYCWAGSYWALTVCGFIGVFALGPAVFLPVLARRRRTWYGGHCGVCGYDMGPTLGALRCPECGTGWKSAPVEAPSGP